MQNYQSLTQLLFLDIETIPMVWDWETLPERLKGHWEKKSARLYADDYPELADSFKEKAGIYAEFGKVVSIAVGMFNLQGDGLQFRLKSFHGKDEKEILMAFAELLNQKFDPNRLQLCAHNGKEFDFPYLCRRLLINQIQLPEVLKIAGKKPWDVKHLDTLELWKFGDYKNYTSLDLLAAIFDLPTSKGDIDGSQVAKVFYEEGEAGLERIARYCQEDVLLTARLYLKMNYFEELPDEAVHYS